MDRKQLTKWIGDVLDDITRLNNALYAMDSTDLQRYPDNYEVMSTEAALRGEKIACQLRHLIYNTTNVKKNDYLLSAAAAQDIKVVNADGIIEITLPRLLPKRNRRQGTEFLIDPIYAALDKFVCESKVTKIKHCVVCFSHIYCRHLPMSRIRDFDNIEMKQLLDVIAAFILVDDNGALCDAYTATEFGDSDCTCISVMENYRFQEWLEQRKGRVKNICDF